MDDLTPALYHTDFFQHWATIEKGSIDLILTDQPYGLFGNEKTLKNMGWDKKLNIPQLEKIFNTVLKKTGQVLMFCNLALLIDLLTGFTNHFQFRFYFVWVKSCGMPISKMRPINNTEFILCFRKKGVLEKDLTWHPYELSPEKGLPYTKRNFSTDIPTRKGRKQDININNHGWRYPKATLHFPSRPNFDKAERELSTHPCMKSEALLRRIVRGFSNPGDTILDPFSGSASTLAACIKEGRKSIGYELQSTFYAEAKQRIENLVAQEVLFT